MANPAKTNKTNSNFKVTIHSTTGACDTNLFKKMCERGDLNSVRVKGAVGDIIKVNGIANVTIECNGEEPFDIHYYAPDNGTYSSGSELFYESVTDYIDECSTFKIITIKTKRGMAFKASPILGDTEIETIE